MIKRLPYPFNWWAFRWKMKHELRKKQVAIKQDYDKYLHHAFQKGIHALSFGDWCAVTSLDLPVDVDPTELAHHVALGMYPVCRCGGWMHQHENFSGFKKTCPEECSKFHFSHFESPWQGAEPLTAVAFNQAIYNYDELPNE